MAKPNAPVDAKCCKLGCNEPATRWFKANCEMKALPMCEEHNKAERIKLALRKADIAAERRRAYSGF